MTDRPAVSRSPRNFLGFLCGAALLGGVPIAHAAAVAAEGMAPPPLRRLLDLFDESAVHQCLSADAGRAVENLVATGALQPVLGSELTLGPGDIRAKEILVEIRDQSQQSHGITLALPGVRGEKPDGKGARFLFYLAPASSPSNPRAASALLAVAGLVDGAIPDTALVRCARGGESPVEPSAPRAVALASGAVQAGVVAVVILFGLRALRPRAGRAEGDDSTKERPPRRR